MFVSVLVNPQLVVFFVTYLASALEAVSLGFLLEIHIGITLILEHPAILAVGFGCNYSVLI